MVGGRLHEDRQRVPSSLDDFLHLGAGAEHELDLNLLDLAAGEVEGLACIFVRTTMKKTCFRAVCIH